MLKKVKDFEKWIISHYGKKCPDYDKDCILCRIWKKWESLKKEIKE